MHFNMAHQVNMEKKKKKKKKKKKINGKKPIAARNFCFSRAAKGTVKELLWRAAEGTEI